MEFERNYNLIMGTLFHVLIDNNLKLELQPATLIRGHT